MGRGVDDSSEYLDTFIGLGEAIKFMA